LLCYCSVTIDTLLWRGLTGVHAAPKTALKNLTAHFNSDQQLIRADADSGSHKRSRRLVTVCLVDEMDYLISRNFDVMYHFYSWPQHRHANFVLIGIANTMDLPEKLSSKYVTLWDL
jgi:origin recognition complex subunit 1